MSSKIKTKRERVKFASDNVVGACPEVLDAIVKANDGIAAPYGNDEWSTNLQNKFSEIFEKDVIVYPTGGGTGIVGMWKAFDEMEQLGWIDGSRPRMYAVQSDGCAPIVRAFENGDEFAEPWENANTFAAGIRVPGAIGDYLILGAIRESEGSALSVSDESILSMMKTVASTEGMFICPEGAATAVALTELMAEGSIVSDERVLLLNTGSGLKYLDLLGDIKTHLTGNAG